MSYKQLKIKSLSTTNLQQQHVLALTPTPALHSTFKSVKRKIPGCVRKGSEGTHCNKEYGLELEQNGIGKYIQKTNSK